MNHAYCIHKKGNEAKFLPYFTKGEKEAREFATLAAQAINDNGISLVIGKDASQAAINKAISLLVKASLRCEDDCEAKRLALSRYEKRLPIGAPVMVTFLDKESQDSGTKPYPAIIAGYDDDPLSPWPIKVKGPPNGWCKIEEVKIRYDNPAPFTLWQRNRSIDSVN